MSEPLLLAARVNEIFKDCMFTSDEDRRTHIAVPGIRTAGFWFNPGRLNQYGAEVLALLNELPDHFKQGASLADAWWDRRGRQWPEHFFQIEMLLAIGLALKFVIITVPPAVWPTLPEGLPYVTVTQE